MRYFMPKNITYQNIVRWLYLLCFALTLAGLILLSTYAKSTGAPTVAPIVSYVAAANTVIIGSSSGAAASQSITIPDLAATLATQGYNNLLIDQGSGIWLLKASLVVDTTAKLEITTPTVAWLRLESPPIHAIKIMTQRGGHLLIDGSDLIQFSFVKIQLDQSSLSNRHPCLDAA